MTTDDMMILTVKLRPDYSMFHLLMVAYFHRYQNLTSHQISIAATSRFMDMGIYPDDTQVHLIQPDVYKVKHAIQKVRNHCNHYLRITTSKVRGNTVYSMGAEPFSENVMMGLFSNPIDDRTVQAFRNFVDACVDEVL